MFPRKSPAWLQLSSTFPPKSPIFPHKSPVHLQKSPTSRENTHTCVCVCVCVCVKCSHVLLRKLPLKILPPRHPPDSRNTFLVQIQIKAKFQYDFVKRNLKMNMYRKILRTHCNTLQHTATHCNTLQHTATHCYVSQDTEKSEFLDLVDFQGAAIQNHMTISTERG